MKRTACNALRVPTATPAKPSRMEAANPLLRVTQRTGGAKLRCPTLRWRLPLAKVFGHRHGAGATRAAKPRQVPGVLDGLQQAVMGFRHAGLKSCPRQRRDHQRGDSATGGIRAASNICAPFIPRDEKNATVKERGRVEDGWNLAAEPGIS